MRQAIREALDGLERAPGAIDRPILAIAALATATFAQGTLTWNTALITSVLISLSVLLLGLILFEKDDGTHPGQRYRITITILLLLVMGAGLVLKTLTSLSAAIPLFVIAVVLFVLAVGAPRESHPDMSEPYSSGEIVLVVLIITLGFCLQSYHLERIPPGFHGDEGESGMQALALLHGQVDRLISVGWYHLPMMSFAWHAASMRIFGENVFGLRMSSVIVGTLTFIPFYLLTRLLFGRRTALLATFLLAISHAFIALNRLGINYTQTTLFEVTTFYFLFRGLRSGKWWDFALGGLFMGAGLYVYYASRLVPFVVAGFLICGAIARRGLLRSNRRGVTIMWLATVLTFAPMAVYFAQHPWHFISRTSHVFVLGEQGWVDAPYARDSPALTLVNQAARVLPLFNYGGDMSGQYGYRGPMLDFITAVLFVLGLAYSIANSYRPRHFFVHIWFWATLVAGGMLTLPAPFVPRLSGMLPVLFVFAALAVDRTWELFAQMCANARVAKCMLYGLVGAMLAAVAFLNYDVYFNRYLPTIQGWAMREPATAIARYVNSLGDDYDFYLLGEPKLYVRHGTIRFIARDASGTDVLDPSRYIPLRGNTDHNAAYLLLPSHQHHLQSIMQYYPNGIVRHFSRESGELWFTTVEITKDDIVAAISAAASP